MRTTLSEIQVVETGGEDCLMPWPFSRLWSLETPMFSLKYQELQGQLMYLPQQDRIFIY